MLIPYNSFKALSIIKMAKYIYNCFSFCLSSFILSVLKVFNLIIFNCNRLEVFQVQPKLPSSPAQFTQQWQWIESSSLNSHNTSSRSAFNLVCLKFLSNQYGIQKLQLQHIFNTISIIDACKFSLHKKKKSPNLDIKSRASGG